MNRKYTLLGLSLIGLAIIVTVIYTTDLGETDITGSIIESERLDDDPEKTTVYYFFDEDCPICEVATPFLENLDNEYPEMELKKFDVDVTEDRNIFYKFAELYTIARPGVPMTIISDESPIIGFEGEETTGQEIEDTIQNCIEENCPNPGNVLRENFE